MFRAIAGLVLLVWLAPAARAQHLDVWLAKVGPRTDVAAFDFDGGGIVVPGARVFEQDLSSSPPVYAGSNPGFTAGASSYPYGWAPLPSNVDVTFEVLRERTLGWNLLHWNGAGAVAFASVPDDEVLVIDENGCVSCAQLYVDGGTSDLAGFVLDQTTSAGSLHVHHDYFLLGDETLTDPPTPGIYLVALRARAGTLDWTPPFFLVFGVGATATQRADAADWVEANLVFSACDDDTDNDGDGKVDWDGGGLGEPVDPGCQGNPARGSERPPASCGLGFEAALPLLALAALRRRIRRG